MTKNLVNPEYEAALLGTILYDNNVLEEYDIRDSMFSAHYFPAVWQAIKKIRATGAVATIMEVGHLMQDRAAEIATLTDYANTYNAAHYVSELSELAKRRGLDKLGNRVQSMLSDGHSSDDVTEVVDKALLALAVNSETSYKALASSMGQTMREIEEATKRTTSCIGIPTGLGQLDDKVNGWQKQHLIIIGARPGAGKTSIMLNMASAAVRHGVAVGIFSAEMSTVQLAKRLIADWGGVNYGRLQSGLLGSGELQKIVQGAQELAAQKMFINDTPSIMLKDLVSDARAMKRKEGIGLVCVDYLSLVSNKSNGIPRHEQVAEISAALKGLARELDLPVVVLSQLTREAQGERPKLSQLRDSGAVEQDADIVILLHNLGYVDEATKEQVKINLIVEKNRHGMTGDVPLLFKPARMRMHEVQEKWEQDKKR